MTAAASRADNLLLLQELTAFEADYWYEVDHNWGRGAAAFYADGGVFVISGKPMNGPRAVADFYAWRESRGERTARHVVTNFRLTKAEGARAGFVCIMCLYAADGAPVLPSLPAIMIADIAAECERGADGRWRFLSHKLTPIFEGGVPATIPQS